MVTDYKERVEVARLKKPQVIMLGDAIDTFEVNSSRLEGWLKELEGRRRVLDELEEAYREMDEWEFLEYCKELWG